MIHSEDYQQHHSGAPAHQRCVSGAPYLRKFGNPSIWKIWVVTWQSICPFICLYANTSKTKRVAPLPQLHVWFWASTLLLSDICHIKLSADQYHVTFIVGSGLELIKVVCFLKLTADQLLVFRLDRGLRSCYFPGREGGSTRKGKILAQIYPWRIVDFSFDIFLAQSSLGKSLTYCIRNFYNLG